MWPVPLIYRCAEALCLGYITLQVVLALVQCRSFGARVILGFIEIVLNSHNLEFNLLFLSPPQCPES